MEELLRKIRELNPSCVVTFLDTVPLDVQKLFLIFIARMQLGSSHMYNRYDIKLCQYMGRSFYKLSFGFSSDANSASNINLHFYPFLNVDCETLDMFHASGKVARANLYQKDYLCRGYGWYERNSNLVTNDQRKVCDDFVQQHNLL